MNALTRLDKAPASKLRNSGPKLRITAVRTMRIPHSRSATLPMILIRIDKELVDLL